MVVASHCIRQQLSQLQLFPSARLTRALSRYSNLDGNLDTVQTQNTGHCIHVVLRGNGAVHESRNEATIRYQVD